MTLGGIAQISENVTFLQQSFCRADSFYIIVGRILVHGLLTTGYWPQQLSVASVAAASRITVTNSLYRCSFLEFVGEDTRQTLLALTDDLFDSVSAEKRLDILSSLESKTDPTSSEEAKVLVEHLARVHLLVKPFYYLRLIRKGMKAYLGLFSGVGEEVFSFLRLRGLPTVQKVVDSLKYSFSEERPTLMSLEMRVQGYLENFIRQCEPKDIVKFLVFCTATDILQDQESINIEFNSSQGLSRAPSATTCSSTLSVSRYYISREDFDGDLRKVIREEHAFDAI